MQEFVKPHFALTAMLSALLLSGCAGNPPLRPAVSPSLPPPPSLSTPLPSTSYSLTAEKRMQAWSQLLTDTQVMSEPSPKPGQ